MIKSFFRYVNKSTAHTATGLCVLFLLALGVTHAAQTTSYDVTNNPQMFLDVSISSVQTSNIKLAALTRNGDTVIFPNMTGGVLRFRQGSYLEDLSFTGATVNSTTKQVTLLGVTRDICWNQANRLVTCGSGIAWSKGTIVELNVDSRLLNFKANIDRANTFTARNGVRFSASGSLGQPTFATTAARDQQLGATPAAGSGLTACVTATGLCYDGLGGTWVARGANATANGSETVAGKFQVTSFAHLSNRTQTGATNALNALTPRWLTKIGTGATSAFLIPQLNQNGLLDATFGAMGSGSYAQSGVLLGNHKSKFTTVAGGTSGNVLRFNGDEWTSTASPGGVLTFASGSVSIKLTANSGEQTFDKTRTFNSNELTAGSIYHFDVFGTGAITSGGTAATHKLKLGATQLCAHQNTFAAASKYGWHIDGFLSVQSVGASGKVHVTCDSTMGSALAASGSTLTIDTTASQVFQSTVTHNSNNGYAYLIDLLLFKVR